MIRLGIIDPMLSFLGVNSAPDVNIHMICYQRR